MIRSMTTPVAMTARRKRAFQPRPEWLEGRQLLSAGDLDPSFGSGGYMTTNSPRSAPDTANAVQIQTDGKILVSGNGGVAGTFEVVRLTPSGTLDPTFGSSGRAEIWPSGTFGSSDMALQQDGRIVLVGTHDSGQDAKGKYVNNLDFAVVRFLASGTLDTSFGPNHDGEVKTNISTYTTSDGSNKADYAQGIAIQSDGKILVGGRAGGPSHDFDSALVRYNADGSLDTSFGQGGKVVTARSTGRDGILGIAVQSNGRIVAGGSFLDLDGQLKYYLARYNVDGSPDDGSTADTTPGDSFGTGGLVVAPFRIINTAYDGHLLALQPDDAIVLARQSYNGFGNDLAVARYTAAGAPDTSFGGGTGAETVDFGADERSRSVAVQTDGKLVVVGYSQNPATGIQDTLIACFQPNGGLDTGFGNGGSVIHSFSSPGDTSGEGFYDVALQTDGKIVAVGGVTPPGRTSSASSGAFLVARYLGASSATMTATASTKVIAQPTSLAAQGISVLTPLASDQDMTLLAIDLIHSGSKRSRSASHQVSWLDDQRLS